MQFIILLGLGFVVYLVFKDKRLFKSTTKESFTGLETIDDKFNAQKKNDEDELNELLDKVNQKGLEKLSKKELARLKELSK